MKSAMRDFFLGPGFGDSGYASVATDVLGDSATGDVVGVATDGPPCGDPVATDAVPWGELANG